MLSKLDSNFERVAIHSSDSNRLAICMMEHIGQNLTDSVSPTDLIAGTIEKKQRSTGVVEGGNRPLLLEYYHVCQ